MAPASSPERVDDYIASLPDGRREIAERPVCDVAP
jgi:hypothetical protein